MYYNLKEISEIFYRYLGNNKGYNINYYQTTGIINKNNTLLSFSSAINVSNSRIILVPYNSDKIVLFTVNEGIIFERPLPIQGRFINAHLLDDNKVLLIPADSNVAPFIYDITSGSHTLEIPCKVNGDLELKDIFANSVMIDNENIFCSNKDTNKCYIYNLEKKVWRGYNTNYQTSTFSSIKIIKDYIVLSNRKNIFSEETIFELFNLKTKSFSKLILPFEIDLDEFVGIVWDLKDSIYLIPYKSRELIKLTINDNLEILNYKRINLFSDKSVNGILKEECLEKGISLGACIIPNGNILMAPFGTPNAIEYNVKENRAREVISSTSEGGSSLTGCLLMPNGLVFGVPGFRKSGVVWGTEDRNGSSEVYKNIFFNTSR